MDQCYNNNDNDSSLADVINNHLILNLNWPLQLSLENEIKMTSKRRVISLICNQMYLKTFSSE